MVHTVHWESVCSPGGTSSFTGALHGLLGALVYPWPWQCCQRHGCSCRPLCVVHKNSSQWTFSDCSPTEPSWEIILCAGLSENSLNPPVSFTDSLAHLHAYFLLIVFTVPCSYMSISYSNIPMLIPKLPSWACFIETKNLGLADQSKAFEFLISSPVHPPVPHCLYPEDGLLLSDTEDRWSPEKQSNYTTTHLEACSQVRALDI